MKIYKSVSALLSTVVASVLIALISQEYFIKETVTDIESAKSDIPAISLCFDNSITEFVLNDSQSIGNNLQDAIKINELIVNISVNEVLPKFISDAFIRNEILCYRLRFQDLLSNSLEIMFHDIVTGVSLAIHNNDSYPNGNYPLHYFSRSGLDDTGQRYHVKVSRYMVHRRSNCKHYKSYPQRIDLVNSSEPHNKLASYGNNKLIPKSRILSCQEEINELSIWSQAIDFRILIRGLAAINVIKYKLRVSINMYLIYVSSLLASIYSIAFVSILHVSVIKKLKELLCIRIRLKRLLFVKCIVYFLCFLGCLYQVTDITEQFANHDTNKETYIGPPLVMAPAALTICLNPEDILDNDRTSNTPCKQGNRIINASQCTDYLATLSCEQLSQLCQNPKIIIYFDILVPQHTIYTFNSTPYTYFCKSNRLCFTLPPVDNKVTSYVVSTRGIQSRTWLYIHKNNELPYYDSKKLDVDLSYASKFELSYTIMSTQLLKFPFKSDCREYYISRANCYETCVRHLYFDMINRHPCHFSSNISLNYNVKSTCSDIPLHISNLCKQKCQQPDCLRTEFYLDVISKRIYDKVIFRVALPHLHISHRQTPKVYTNDLLICVASSLGLWFGLSLNFPLGLLRYISRSRGLIRRCYKAILYTLLVIMCFIHLMSTFEDYLRRLTISKTSVSTTEPVTLPCIYVFAYTFKGWGCFRNPNCQAPIYKIIQNIEILAKHNTYFEKRNVSDFEVYRYFHFTSEHYVLCPRKIVVYDPQKLRALRSTTIVKIQYPNGLFVTFSLLSRNLDNFRQLSPVQYLTSSSITYKKSNVKLLPPPYASNCLDYTTVGFLSREMCEMKCMVNRVLREGGFLSKRLYIEHNDTRARAAWHGGKSSDVGGTPDEFWVSPECASKCARRDCESETYQISASTYEPEELESHSSRYLNIKIGTTQTTSELIPRQSFIEFLVYILGIVGLWLGLSIESVLRTLFRKLFRCYRRGNKTV